MKQKLIRLWKWIGPFSGVAGLFMLLKLVDVGAVAVACAGAASLWLLPAALLILSATGLRAWRWILLFRQRNVNIPFGRLLGTNLIGSFYGQFLPMSSAVGATLLFAENSRGGGKGVDFITTVLVERVINLVSLFAAGSLVLLVARPAGLPGALSATAHLASISLVAGLLCLRRGWGIGWLGRLLGRLRLEKVGQHLQTLSQALQSDLGHRRVIGLGIVLSLSINLCIMAASYLVTLAIAGPVPFLSFMAMAALIITLQGVPITPGSLGMREGLYVFFLGLLGVGRAEALTVGLFVMLLGWLQWVLG